MPAWATAVAVVADEVALAILIRDNLALDVLMLVWPLGGVKA